MTTPGLHRLNVLRRTVANLIAGVQSVQSLHFDTLTETPTYAPGVVYYRDGVLNVMAEFGDVIMQVGEELQFPVVNKQGGGTTILNGQPVYVKGAQGQRLAVGLADSADLSTVQVIGLATHDIADNQNGRVTFVGAVRDLDTSSYTVGNEVYVDGLGTLTTTKPTAAGTYAAQLGIVTQAHPVQGVIHVHAPRLQYPIAGATATRPTTPRVGDIWFDTTLDQPVWWDGTQWVLSTGIAA